MEGSKLGRKEGRTSGAECEGVMTRTLQWSHHVTQRWPQEGMKRAQQLHCCCARGTVGAAQALLGPVDDALDVESRQQEVRHCCLDPVEGLGQHLGGTAHKAAVCELEAGLTFGFLWAAARLYSSDATGWGPTASAAASSMLLACSLSLMSAILHTSSQRGWWDSIQFADATHGFSVSCDTPSNRLCECGWVLVESTP